MKKQWQGGVVVIAALTQSLNYGWLIKDYKEPPLVPTLIWFIITVALVIVGLKLLHEEDY